MIIVIDNYDSFVYNLVQYLRELHQEVLVLRNDRATVEEVAALGPERIVISPGPRGPDEAGISLAVIRYFAGRVPVLGVCLGHQAVGRAFGGRVVRSPRPVHGKTSPIYHCGRGIYRGLPNPFAAARYHSLLVERESLPACLEITAQTESGEIMGLRHKKYAVEGVQFHPESILTAAGKQLLANFIYRDR